MAKYSTPMVSKSIIPPQKNSNRHFYAKEFRHSAERKEGGETAADAISGDKFRLSWQWSQRRNEEKGDKRKWECTNDAYICKEGPKMQNEGTKSADLCRWHTYELGRKHLQMSYVQDHYGKEGRGSIVWNSHTKGWNGVWINSFSVGDGTRNPIPKAGNMA